MRQLEEKLEIIRTEFDFLLQHEYRHVKELIPPDLQSQRFYDSVSAKFESPKRFVAVRHFLRSSDVDLTIALDNQASVNEGTDIWVVSKDHDGNKSGFSVNHYMRLVDKELYSSKLNTYRTQGSPPFDNEKFLSLIGNYRQLLETRFLDLIEGREWISTYIERLDGWTIEENGRIVLIEGW